MRERYKGFDIGTKIYIHTYAYFVHKADPLTSLTSEYIYETEEAALIAARARVDKFPSVEKLN